VDLVISALLQHRGAGELPAPIKSPVLWVARSNLCPHLDAAGDSAPSCGGTRRASRPDAI